MKTIKILLSVIIACCSFQSLSAQSGKEAINDKTQTDSVKVYGECGMCKKRIEKAAYAVEGVKLASWDEDSKILIIKHDLFVKDVPDNVQKKLASIGHDTGKYEATDAAYQSLPECCHYQRKQ